jgi:hypothetical protein
MRHIISVALAAACVAVAVAAALWVESNIIDAFRSLYDE